MSDTHNLAGSIARPEDFWRNKDLRLVPAEDISSSVSSFDASNNNGWHHKLGNNNNDDEDSFSGFDTDASAASSSIIESYSPSSITTHHTHHTHNDPSKHSPASQPVTTTPSPTVAKTSPTTVIPSPAIVAPITQAVKPSLVVSNTIAKPVSIVVKPAAIVAKPAALTQNTQISTPATVPATPATVPATPATVPATPATVPATPATVPATPATVPATPATVPATPATVPATPATVPATPATVPATPATVPATPATVPPVAVDDESGESGEGYTTDASEEAPLDHSSEGFSTDASVSEIYENAAVGATAVNGDDHSSDGFSTDVSVSSVHEGAVMVRSEHSSEGFSTDVSEVAKSEHSSDGFSTDVSEVKETVPNVVHEPNSEEGYTTDVSEEKEAVHEPNSEDGYTTDVSELSGVKLGTREPTSADGISTDVSSQNYTTPTVSSFNTTYSEPNDNLEFALDSYDPSDSSSSSSIYVPKKVEKKVTKNEKTPKKDVKKVAKKDETEETTESTEYIYEEIAIEDFIDQMNVKYVKKDNKIEKKDVKPSTATVKPTPQSTQTIVKTIPQTTQPTQTIVKVPYSVVKPQVVTPSSVVKSQVVTPSSVVKSQVVTPSSVVKTGPVVKYDPSPVREAIVDGIVDTIMQEIPDVGKALVENIIQDLPFDVISESPVVIQDAVEEIIRTRRVPVLMSKPDVSSSLFSSISEEWNKKGKNEKKSEKLGAYHDYDQKSSIADVDGCGDSYYDNDDSVTSIVTPPHPILAQYNKKITLEKQVNTVDPNIEDHSMHSNNGEDKTWWKKLAKIEDSNLEKLNDDIIETLEKEDIVIQTEEVIIVNEEIIIENEETAIEKEVEAAVVSTDLSFLNSVSNSSSDPFSSNTSDLFSSGTETPSDDANNDVASSSEPSYTFSSSKDVDAPSDDPSDVFSSSLPDPFSSISFISETIDPSPVAAKPTPIAAKPVAVVTKPDPVTAKPIADVANPVPVTTKTITGVAKPAPVIAKPVTSIAKPAPAVAKPTSVVAKPVAAVAKPAPVIAKSSPEVTKPAVVDAKHAPTAVKPVTEDVKSTTDVTKTVPTAVKPVTEDVKSTTDVTKTVPIFAKPTPVIAKQPPVVAKPGSAVSKPNAVVSKPVPVVAKPSPSIVKPDAVVAKPVSVIAKHSHAKPIVVITKPAVAKPVAVDGKAEDPVSEIDFEFSTTSGFDDGEVFSYSSSLSNASKADDEDSLGESISGESSSSNNDEDLFSDISSSYASQHSKSSYGYSIDESDNTSTSLFEDSKKGGKEKEKVVDGKEKEKVNVETATRELPTNLEIPVGDTQGADTVSRDLPTVDGEEVEVGTPITEAPVPETTDRDLPRVDDGNGDELFQPDPEGPVAVSSKPKQSQKSQPVGRNYDYTDDETDSGVYNYSHYRPQGYYDGPVAAPYYGDGYYCEPNYDGGHYFPPQFENHGRFDNNQWDDGVWNGNNCGHHSGGGNSCGHNGSCNNGKSSGSGHSNGKTGNFSAGSNNNGRNNVQSGKKDYTRKEKRPTPVGKSKDGKTRYNNDISDLTVDLPKPKYTGRQNGDGKKNVAVASVGEIVEDDGTTTSDISSISFSDFSSNGKKEEKMFGGSRIGKKRLSDGDDTSDDPEGISSDDIVDSKQPKKIVISKKLSDIGEIRVITAVGPDGAPGRRGLQGPAGKTQNHLSHSGAIVVDQKYGDDNRGNRENVPFRTVGKAIKNCFDDDTLYIHTGRYGDLPIKSNINVEGQGRVTVANIKHGATTKWLKDVEFKNLTFSLNVESLKLDECDNVKFRDCVFNINRDNNNIKGLTGIEVDNGSVDFKNCVFNVHNAANREDVRCLNLKGKSDVNVNGCKLFVNGNEAKRLSLATTSDDSKVTMNNNDVNITNDNKHGCEITCWINYNCRGYSVAHNNNINVDTNNSNSKDVFNLAISSKGSNDNLNLSGNRVHFKHPKTWEGKAYIGASNEPSSTISAINNTFNLDTPVAANNTYPIKGRVNHSSHINHKGNTLNIRKIDSDYVVRPDDEILVIVGTKSVTITLPKLDSTLNVGELSVSRNLKIKSLTMQPHLIKAATTNMIDNATTLKLSNSVELYSLGNRWITWIH